MVHRMHARWLLRPAPPAIPIKDLKRLSAGKKGNFSIFLSMVQMITLSIDNTQAGLSFTPNAGFPARRPIPEAGRRNDITEDCPWLLRPKNKYLKR
jgi:hypothetical protein